MQGMQGLLHLGQFTIDVLNGQVSPFPEETVLETLPPISVHGVEPYFCMSACTSSAAQAK